MPKKTKRLEETLSPEEAILEVQHRHRLGQAFMGAITVNDTAAAKEAAEKTLTKPGDPLYHFDELDTDPALRERNAQALFEAYLPRLEAPLGIKYEQLKKDPSAQKHILWALYGRTKDTIRANIEKNRGNYYLKHKQAMAAHVKNIDEELPVLATEHISDQQLRPIAKYLKIDESEPSSQQLRLQVYQAALKYEPTTKSSKYTGKVVRFPASPLEDKIAKAQGELADDLDTKDSAYKRAA